MIKNKPNKTLKALSLFEAILYILIASVLGLLIVNFWSSIQQTNQRVQIINQTHQHAENANALIEYWLERSDSIVSPTAQSQTNMLELTAGADNIVIQIDTDRLVIENNGVTTQLTDDYYQVSNLIFTNYGSNQTDSISYQFDISSANPNRIQNLDYTYQVSAAYTLR